jgi:hypothetical protein
VTPPEVNHLTITDFARLVSGITAYHKARARSEP